MLKYFPTIDCVCFRRICSIRPATKKCTCWSAPPTATLGRRRGGLAASDAHCAWKRRFYHACPLRMAVLALSFLSPGQKRPLCGGFCGISCARRSTKRVAGAGYSPQSGHHATSSSSRLNGVGGGGWGGRILMSAAGQTGHPGETNAFGLGSSVRSSKTERMEPMAILIQAEQLSY